MPRAPAPAPRTPAPAPCTCARRPDTCAQCLRPGALAPAPHTCVPRPGPLHPRPEPWHLRPVPAPGPLHLCPAPRAPEPVLNARRKRRAFAVAGRACGRGYDTRGAPRSRGRPARRRVPSSFPQPRRKTSRPGGPCARTGAGAVRGPCPAPRRIDENAATPSRGVTARRLPGPRLGKHCTGSCRSVAPTCVEAVAVAVVTVPTATTGAER